MDRLRGSESLGHDRATFFRAQITFWLMAATDGHAKNFSLRLLPGGRYQLAPPYAILSTYPIHGTGPNHLAPTRRAWPWLFALATPTIGCMTFIAGIGSRWRKRPAWRVRAT